MGAPTALDRFLRANPTVASAMRDQGWRAKIEAAVRRAVKSLVKGILGGLLE